MMRALCIWVALGVAAARANGVRVVRPGETIEDIAAELGDPALAAALRGTNGLLPGAEPVPGTVLRLPPLPGHEDRDGALLFLRGTATREGPTAPRAPAAERDPLPVGSTICTGTDSFATVRLAVDLTDREHDDVNLGPETCLTLTALTSTPEGRASAVRVGRGRIVIRSANRRGDVIVESDAGVTTGDQGGFRVAVESDGAARTEALYGAVAVIGSGVERSLRAGQGSRTRPGEAPSAPIDLLPPGSPLRPDVGATLRRAEFTWSAIDEALGYRVELSTQADFSEVVFASESPVTRLAPDALYLPGRQTGLWWRVTSFDLTGFEGPPSDARPVTLPSLFGP